MGSASTSRAKTIRVVLIWANVAVGVIALFFVAAGGAMVGYGRLYENRIFPGVRILGVRLDGLTPTEAQKTLHDSIDAALGKGLQFKYRGRDVSLEATTVSTDPDAARDLVRYSIDGALTRAYELGRSGSWQENLISQLRLRIAPITVPAEVIVDRQTITDELQAALHDSLHDAVNAHLDIANTAPLEVSVKSEEPGVVLEMDPALDALDRQAKLLSFAPIELSDRKVTPAVSFSDVEPLLPQAVDYLKRPGLTFTYDASRFAVPTSTLAGWVTVTGTSGSLALTLDPASFGTGIKKLAVGVEQQGKNGSLVIKDGKIESFVSGTQGVGINVQATLDQVLAHWPASSTFPIIVETTQGSLEGEDPERMGIKELLGVGHSNFSGSPSNRRKNIAHGAALVNGSIIQPGETFSLLKTLGEIDGAHKWLPELVIKGNETKPEFGGGLCQIGTTTFRAALASGMPIVERQNHSYRVRYYEPAGTDATIYDPKPDFRFMNDSAHPVLINAYLKGDDAYFEFWGTKDGRKAIYSGATEVTSVNDLRPRVYNVASPPPMKLVETLDLAPGKKKCTETAHAGADAEFGYTVTYQNGEVKKQVFQSHYRPWQAVCLVGVEKLTTPVDTGSATGSAAVLD